MKSSIIFFLLLLCITQVSAQNDRLLTPQQLKTDVDFFFKTLHTHHPNPYYYCSLNEFEDKKNKIYSQINKPLTHEQFAWIIGEINSCLDMHSMVNIYFLTHWRKNFLNNKSIKLFPVVKIKNKKLYLKTTNIEIEEINGIKANEIIQDLRKYFNWKLPYERNIYSMEACFSCFLMYKYSLETPFKVKFSNANSIQILEGSTLNEYNKESSGGIRGGIFGYSYKIYPNSSIAIFNIMDFEEYNKEILEKKLNEFFKEVNSLNIQNVFYDLTMNGGGIFNLKALDIIKHDSVYFKLNVIDRIDQFNKKHKINEIVLYPTDSVIRFNRKHKVSRVVLYPNKSLNIPIKRKLFVLQGNNTASGADYFCRIVAENKLGTLVGQNTGEPTIGFSYSFTSTMPNSKITFGTATSFCDFSDYFKQETLYPDVYWDVNNCREFTEQELVDIVKYRTNTR